MGISFWKRKPDEIPLTRIAVSEYRGHPRRIDAKWVDTPELVEYPEKS
jgi:hypothetical protein